MRLLLIVLLQVANLLSASANDSTEAKNALFQQVTVEDKIMVQSNETTGLEKDDLVALLKSNEEIAQEQINQLSLVTRYTGTGYNLVRGNPEGDFNRGGIDPGIRTTNEVFSHTYTKGRTVYYLGRRMAVPDQVNFHMTQSCAASESVQAYSGRKSYMKELEKSVSVSGGYSGIFASVSFSLSYGMAQAEKYTQKTKKVMIQKNKICNYGRARYLYENAIARERQYTLTRSFKNSVNYQLPTRYNTRAYMNFIEKWGTHIILTLDVGTREIFRSSASYTEVYKYLKKKNSLSTSVSGRYGLVSGSARLRMSKLNENINHNTQLGKRVIKFMIGSRSVPLPIHIKLIPLTKALDPIWWGGYGPWRRSRINLKQRNLARAVRNYPRYVRATTNTDPRIVIKITPQWPDGTYALPMPQGGCPSQWSSGYRYQDTEDRRNSNGKSSGIERKMKVVVGSNIRFYYCVKTVRGNTGYRWPRGSYCIAKKGSCPRGFRYGSIYWDDEDRRNGNRKWGTLPDGSYGSNTEVQYCCRNDGRYSRPIALPTRRPFILYRYGGRCQRVSGMRTYELYIKWDDEDRRNRDNCKGSHPDATCRNNQLLRFCYYSRR